MDPIMEFCLCFIMAMACVSTSSWLFGPIDRADAVVLGVAQRPAGISFECAALLELDGVLLDHLAVVHSACNPDAVGARVTVCFSRYWPAAGRIDCDGKPTRGEILAILLFCWSIIGLVAVFFIVRAAARYWESRVMMRVRMRGPDVECPEPMKPDATPCRAPFIRLP